MITADLCNEGKHLLKYGSRMATMMIAPKAFAKVNATNILRLVMVTDSACRLHIRSETVSWLSILSKSFPKTLSNRPNGCNALSILLQGPPVITHRNIEERKSRVEYVLYRSTVETIAC